MVSFVLRVLTRQNARGLLSFAEERSEVLIYYSTAAVSNGRLEGRSASPRRSPPRQLNRVRYTK